MCRKCAKVETILRAGPREEYKLRNKPHTSDMMLMKLTLRI